MNYFLEILALVLMIGITYYHYYVYNVKKRKIGKWFHFWWGVVYTIPCVIAVWLLKWNWVMAGAFILERFVFYNPILNTWRHLGIFYIVADNSVLGMWDKIEIWWRGFYPYIWGAGVIGFIVIQYFLK